MTEPPAYARVRSSQRLSPELTAHPVLPYLTAQACERLSLDEHFSMYVRARYDLGVEPDRLAIRQAIRADDSAQEYT